VQDSDERTERAHLPQKEKVEMRQVRQGPDASAKVHLEQGRRRDILERMRAARRHGCIATLFGLLVLCLALVYGVAAVTAPWSFQIGGLPTPLWSWSATGTLHAKDGTYPLYVLFYPDSHFSRLRLDGLRPTGGVQGSGSLCTSRGVKQYLKLSGTIYNGWSSTEGSLINFRLLELRYFNLGQRRGYFDLYGRWRGTQLVMDDRGESESTFRSGLRLEHESVTLERGSYSDFEAACASATNFTAHHD
jgi:hypothetical protein